MGTSLITSWMVDRTAQVPRWWPTERSALGVLPSNAKHRARHVMRSMFSPTPQAHIRRPQAGLVTRRWKSVSGHPHQHHGQVMSKKPCPAQVLARWRARVPNRLRPAHLSEDQFHRFSWEPKITRTVLGIWNLAWGV